MAAIGHFTVFVGVLIFDTLALNVRSLRETHCAYLVLLQESSPFHIRPLCLSMLSSFASQTACGSPHFCGYIMVTLAPNIF